METIESKKGLFVSNLPYTTTDEELKEVFSYYGETKGCFTVKNSEGKSKGYGFVYYKSSEDALKAKSFVKKVNGRPVSISFARQKQEKKSTENESDEEDDYELQTSRLQENENQHSDHKAKNHEAKRQSYDIGRIVVLEGLLDTVTSRHIRVRCRKIGEIEAIEYPVPGRETRTAFVTYVKHKEARVAIKKFDGKTFSGGTIKAVLLSKEGRTPSKASLKKSRLIVRNLEFKCSEEDVKDVFSPVGRIIEVHIPKKNGRSRGYAFVQYASYFDALKAVNTINGMTIKDRKVAVDFLAPPKNENKESEKKESGKMNKGVDEGMSVEQLDDSDQRCTSEEDEENMEADGAEGEDEKEKSDQDQLPDDDDEDEEGEEESSAEVGDKSASVVSVKKSSGSDVKEGKTLFLRNVPYDADEEELGEMMKKFGPIRYCRLVQGDITGMCRGMAFVQYKYDTSVQDCLEACCEDEGIMYQNNKLEITLALSKEELVKLKNKKDVTSTDKKDKRNLYLLREGVILRGSDAAKDLSKPELTRRVKSYDERKQKLKNPYYYISKTRLSVRNLPVTINERKLKTLFKSHGGKNATIKQVKLMRSKEKFTEEGLGRSLGYGFVEFTKHEAALRALRAVNNNPSVFTAHRRPIVEFALEDSRAIKLMEERKRLSLKNTHKASGESGNYNIEKGTNPKVKWQLKCKARRLKRKEAGKLSTAAKQPAGSSRIKKTKAIKNETKQKQMKIERRYEHQSNGRLDKTHRFQKKVEKEMKHSRRKLDRIPKSEKKFDDLVEKYRSKLLSQESRWFE